LRDELFDLQPEAFQRREQLRLELSLQLLALLEEVLHQVAESLGELAPGGDGVDLRGLIGPGLLRQGVHTSLLPFKGRSGRLQVYAGERGGGFAAPPVAERARSLYLLRGCASSSVDRWPSG